MKSSTTYLKWFRRVVILGAVIGVGIFASTAGAVGRPPDVQDVAASLSTAVNRPPDIQDVATRMSAGTPDVFERYAAAHPYGKGLNLNPTPKVDPLAVGYLIGKGLSPSEVTSWTTGACSHQVKAASCYAVLNRSAPSTKAVDPLAVGYLIGQGLSPSEVTSWTTGACSHQVKAASCYTVLNRSAPSTKAVNPLAI